MYKVKKKTIREVLFGILLFVLFISIYLNEFKAGDGSLDTLEVAAEKTFMDKLLSLYLPAFSFVNQEAHDTNLFDIGMGKMEEEFPIYDYAQKNLPFTTQVESRDIYDMIVRMEGRDEAFEDEESKEVSGELEEAFQKENENAKQQLEAAQDSQAAKDTLKRPAAPVRTYNMEEYKNFDALIKEFYIIDSTTMVDDTQLNVEKLMEKDLRLKESNLQPQILIYHTHSQESFADSVPGEEADTIMGAGEKLAKILRDEYGYQVIHHKGKYDVEARDYAYTNSAPEIEKILAENPSIEVVIDLHRDEVKEDRKLVTEINGRPTAMFMFFNGLSRTKQTGNIEYLKNPYIEDNLAFSFQLQKVSNEYYPGLTRRIYLKGYRYNMHYRPKSLLVELGAQTNTVEEIENACEPLAHILSIVLSGSV